MRKSVTFLTPQKIFNQRDSYLHKGAKLQQNPLFNHKIERKAHFVEKRYKLVESVRFIQNLLNNFASMNKFLTYIKSSIGLQSFIVWLVIYLLVFIQLSWLSIQLSCVMATVTVAGLISVYYVTQALFIPKLLSCGKKVLYIIFSILTISTLAYICSRLEIFTFSYFHIQPKHELRFVFSASRFFTLFTLTYAISNIIFFSQKTIEDEKQKEQLLSEKKMLEARVLKSQINSHFIFNSLNNIYSMIFFKDEYTSGYVLKLAQMMRYVMEDCETELTPLSKDIEYIENFIDFQRLRFENDKDIIFTYRMDGYGNVSVPPMIFQPLVENCFKHTPLDVDSNSYIHISMEVKGNSIRFVSENSQPLIRSKSLSKGMGIGIENTRRRLSLYYGDRYTLDISDNTDCFRVELSINL